MKDGCGHVYLYLLSFNMCFISLQVITPFSICVVRGQCQRDLFPAHCSWLLGRFHWPIFRKSGMSISSSSQYSDYFWFHILLCLSFIASTQTWPCLRRTTGSDTWALILWTSDAANVLAIHCGGHTCLLGPYSPVHLPTVKPFRRSCIYDCSPLPPYHTHDQHSQRR